MNDKSDGILRRFLAIIYLSTFSMAKIMRKQSSLDSRWEIDSDIGGSSISKQKASELVWSYFTAKQIIQHVHNLTLSHLERVKN